MKLEKRAKYKCSPTYINYINILLKMLTIHSKLLIQYNWRVTQMFQYLQPWHPSSRDAKLATVMRQVGQNEGLRSRMRRNFTFYHLCAVNILTATTCGRTLVYVHGWFPCFIIIWYLTTNFVQPKSPLLSFREGRENEKRISSGKKKSKWKF